MADNEYTEYDLQGFYENEIAPLVNEILKKCKINRLPFVFSCCPYNKDGESIYKNQGNLTGSNELTLYDDRFVRFLLVLGGAKLAPLADVSFDEEAQEYFAEPPVDDEDEMEPDSEDVVDEEETEQIQSLLPSPPPAIFGNLDNLDDIGDL